MDDLVSNEVARPNKALQLTVNFLRRRLIYGVRTPTGPAATPTAARASWGKPHLSNYKAFLDDDVTAERRYTAIETFNYRYIL